MLAEDAVTPRVNALAKQVGDTVEAFFERPNGEIVIVFTNKGKQTFTPESIIEPEVPDFYQEEVVSFVPPIIHTKAEAEEVVKTLPHKSKRKER